MPFGGAGQLSDQISYAPEAKLWHYVAEFYPILTLQITCLRCARHLNLPTFFCFVPSIMHNLIIQGPQLYTNGFHKLSRPVLNPATPGGESRHFDHATNPTCFSGVGCFSLLI